MQNDERGTRAMAVIAPIPAQAPRSTTQIKTVARHFWSEHGIALLTYAALSVALTWPIMRYFRSQIPGITSVGDQDLGMWLLWNFKEWSDGPRSLFFSRLLYYPHGINLFVLGMGPLAGIFALPFWVLGPAAAYNGMILVSLCLTGYCMYLLARALNFTRGVAWFAGLILLVSPIHLAGVDGHPDKVFVGLQPLAILTAYHAMNLKRTKWWAAATGVVLFLLLLHNGYQFLFGILAVAFTLAAALVTAVPNERWHILRRCLLVGIGSAIIAGPLLAATEIFSHDPLFGPHINFSVTSPYFEPDVLEFLIPSFYQASFHPIQPLLHGFQATQPSAPDAWIGLYTLEAAVTIPLVTLILCIVAWRKGDRGSRQWLLFGGCMVILALGPSLRLFGHTHFTNLKQPITLPYAFFVSLPGLDFVRTPARFMEVGYVGIAITAGFGLTALIRRWPQHWKVLLGGATLLLLLECWPMPWPHAPLPQVPQFYQQIQGEHADYGVLDLPYGTPTLDVVYQIYQMTHHKGIAWGYLSHAYTIHPIPTLQRLLRDGLSPSDILLNGAPANPYANAQDDLARVGYRYIVWHKTLIHDLGIGLPDQSAAVISALLGQGVKPLMDDGHDAVYQISPETDPASLVTAIKIDTSWQPRESAYRWSTSPATLEIDSPRPQQGMLQFTPVTMFDPHAATGLGTMGILTVQTPTSSTSVPIQAGAPTSIPIAIGAGRQTVTLTLEAGNFRPSTYGNPDQRLLSFAIQYINLQIT